MSAMDRKKETKKPGQEQMPEIIIRQHRRYTYWVEGRSILGEGSLVLTDHRLLFLNRVESSPEVTAAIRKLADAPIRDVLDHALSLHKNSFQIPLSSIIRAGISMVTVFPQPRFCLSLYYLKGKKPAPHTENFMFKNARSGIFAQPQLFTAMSWSKTIRQAI
jgi:hypothetical protein